MKKQFIYYRLFLILLPFYSNYSYARYTPQATKIYNFFKSQMYGLPQAVKDDTLFVGSFNQVDGSFTGMGSRYIEIPNGHGGHTRSYPIVYSKGLTTHLRFNLSSADYSVLIVDGVEYNNNGRNYFMIALNKRKRIDFKIICGAQNFSNKLNLQPFPINAIGAFTLAEVPLGLIYAAPGINNGLNYADFSTSRSFRTILSMSTSNSSSVTTSGMDDFSKIISLGKQVASGIGGSIGTAMGIGLAGLPTNNVTETIGQTVTDGYEISYANISTSGLNTKLNPPGSGNTFLYITNARFIFCIKNSVITISLLDYEQSFQNDTKWLKEHEVQRYNRLRYLDPFANTAAPNLQTNSRYLEFDDSPLGLNPGQTHSWSNEEITSSTISHSRLNYTTKVTDHEAGWMSSAFLGDESNTRTITISNSNNTQSTQTEQKISEVQLVCPPGGAHNYAAYLDKIFKTVAVVDLSIPVAIPPTSYGILLDINKKPVANTLVYFLVNGKKIITKTDGVGKYIFYAKEVAGVKGSPFVLNKRFAKDKILQPN